MDVLEHRNAGVGIHAIKSIVRMERFVYQGKANIKK
jgi:predicted acetyltransferase